jgi:hypothetical protein
MAKLDEPAATDVDEDALFAPGSWDVGPPSVRRASMMPGRRSKRPPAEAVSPGAEGEPLAPAPAAAPVLVLAKAPELEVASEPLSAADLANADEWEPDSVSGARLVHPSRRSPSVSASCRPVVPASKPVPQRQKTLVSRLPLASFVLSSVGIGFLLFGGPPAAAPAQAAPRPASEETASAPAEKAEPVRAAAVAAPSPATAAPAAEAPGPLGPTAASVPAVVARTTTVELSVYPVDAAVGHLGIMQRGGPPYRFEIPEGKKIAVEVARPGYGTRKVTIDGSTPKLSIGLRKTRDSE